VVRFEKGQRKDDVAHQHLAGFGDEEGIYLVGVAQEKINTFRTEKRRNPEPGARYPWIVAATALLNQYYLYGQDVDFGPFFIKFSSYSPTGRSCASTAITGPNAKPGRPGSRSASPATGLSATRTRPPCSASAVACRRRNRGVLSQVAGPAAAPVHGR
jgi:hypothetical protein